MGFAGHILGCADTTGLNVEDGLDFGVLTPGCNYILKEIKSNDSFFLNKSEFPFSGHVGEYEPGGNGMDEDGNPKDKYVLEKNGKDATACNMDPDGEVFCVKKYF